MPPGKTEAMMVGCGYYQLYDVVVGLISWLVGTTSTKIINGEH